MLSYLEQARIPLQVDIGFGDVVTPAPMTLEYPTLLDSPPPHIRVYPLETIVAEKLEAAVRLAMANSRMKDFYDLTVLAERFAFDGPVLIDAIRNTFCPARHRPAGRRVPESFRQDRWRSRQATTMGRVYQKGKAVRAAGHGASAARDRAVPLPSY
jgi:hypothetical protein